MAKTAKVAKPVKSPAKPAKLAKVIKLPVKMKEAPVKWTAEEKAEPTECGYCGSVNFDGDKFCDNECKELAALDKKADQIATKNWAEKAAAQAARGARAVTREADAEFEDEYDDDSDDE